MSQTGEFSLGDLLADASLGLELVVGSADCLARPISGAHTIEIEHPARWLDREWVMLTTGVRLSSDQGEQRQLVAELADAEITALGFGVGVVHSALPDGVLAEARARDFPVFVVPLRTAFRDVVTLVFESVLSTEIRAFNRIASMQRFLMDAVGQESPRETVVQRLASLIAADVAILHPQGELECATGEIPAAEVMKEVAGHASLAVAFAAGGRHGYAFPIVPGNASETSWLVVAVPREKQLHPLARPAAHATVPLLAAITRLDRAQADREWAGRRATFEFMLDVRDRYDETVVTAEARALGIEVGQGVVALAAVDPMGGEPPSKLLASLEAQLTTHRVPFLSVLREDVVVALIPATADVEHVQTLLPGVRLGVGRAVTRALLVQESLADAELALRSGPGPGIVRYAELGFVSTLLHELPLERLGEKTDQWLAPLRKNPMALEAVEAYLAHGLDVGRTASALHLHPNSIRHRLKRAEQLLDAQLRSPETILALVVALRRPAE